MTDFLVDLEIGALTDAGRKRRDEPNQDSILAMPTNNSTKQPPLLIVADGMGGYQGGADASQIVIESTSKHYKQSQPGQDITAILAEGIHISHQVMRNRAAGNPGLGSMGSTVVMAVPTAEKIVCANVGDSRAYIINGREIKQISRDQSAVAEQVRAGLLTAIQALRHPQRSRLTQSISARRTTVKPFLTQALWSQDDVLVLCTDGLWSVISEHILQAVAWEFPPQEAVEKLVRLSIASGAPDNVSVIVARRKGWKAPRKMDDDITNPGE